MKAMLPALLLLTLMAGPGGAQTVEGPTLRIGTAAETDAADPHHFSYTPDSTLRENVYQALTRTAADYRVQPALAESWSRTDDRTWRFRLKQGVRFSDGAAFGAPDVVATYCRVLNNREELSGSFSRTIRRLDGVVAEGEDTVVVHTVVPEPLLLSDLAAIAILPRSEAPAGVRFDGGTACGGGVYPKVADFNSGRAAVGTGPFRMVQWSPGGAIVLRPNPYYSPAPHWAEVRLTPIPQSAPRLAALLAGDQDIIEAPGTADLPRLRGDAAVRVTTTPTLRLVFLQLDVARDPSPFVVGPNALRDVRVRQALSLALNRAVLDGRIMDGVALPAAQYLPDGMPGTVPGAPVLPYDPAKARALLAAAGYPNGFALTLHATNDRYVNDGQLAQAIVQQWQRIGVRATLETLPGVAYFPRRAKREFSVAMGGWSTGAPETLGFFRVWLATPDEANGVGTSNNGGWSDPAFDADVLKAMATMDDAARAGLLRAASARALEEMPVIPVHFEEAVWASRAGLRYAGRADQETLATDIEEMPK